jgi:hypothetical protein
MRSDEYRRLYVACLGMAQQSTQLDIQSRWLSMAQAWLRLAGEVRNTRNGRVVRSNVLSLRARQRADFNRTVVGHEAPPLSSSFVVY